MVRDKFFYKDYQTNSDSPRCHYNQRFDWIPLIMINNRIRVPDLFNFSTRMRGTIDLESSDFFITKVCRYYYMKAKANISYKLSGGILSAATNDGVFDKKVLLVTCFRNQNVFYDNYEQISKDLELKVYVSNELLNEKHKTIFKHIELVYTVRM